MQNKKNWLEERRKGIGGSDVGTILGFNKYKTKLELFFEKINPIEEKEETEAAYFGNILEDIVAKEFEKRTGKKVRRDRKHYKHKEYKFLMANIDRRIVGEKAILECKTVNAFNYKEWEGEEIPPCYILQVQHYLLVTGLEKAYIAVLIGGNRFIYKEIEKDLELIELIKKECIEFWECVKNRIPPSIDGTLAAERYLNSKYKLSVDRCINLKSEWESKIKTYLSNKELIKKIKEENSVIENNLKNEMKENEKAKINNYQIMWKTYKSNKPDIAYLKEKYPTLYKEILKEGTIRKFSIKEC